MLEIIVGFLAGGISAAGMGGGTILILILSFFMNFSQHEAQATNLIFFIPTAISAILGNINQKVINWKVGTIVAIFGCIGAAIGAGISTRIDTHGLRKYFGFFLLIITIFEIYSYAKSYIFKQKKT